MTRIDPREWHSQALVRVYEANTETTGRARGASKANFIAALTGTAALATQIFIFILKDTFYCSLRAIFKAIGLSHPSSSLWGEWKTSASNTVSYAEGIFFCASGVVSTKASEHAVRFHVQNRIAKIDDLENRLKELQAKITAFNLAQKQADLNMIRSALEKHGAVSNKEQPLIAITQWKNYLVVMIKHLEQTNPQPIYDLHQNLSLYYAPADQEKFDREVIAISNYMGDHKTLLDHLTTLSQKIGNTEKTRLERQRRELQESQKNFYSEVALSPLVWEKSSFDDLQQRERDLQEVQGRLKELREMFNAIAHLLNEQEKVNNTAWFETREKGIQEQQTKIPQVIQERRQKAFEALKREAYDSRATIATKYSELCSLMINTYQNQNMEAFIELCQLAGPLLKEIDEAACCLDKAKEKLQKENSESARASVEELNAPLVKPELLGAVNSVINDSPDEATLREWLLPLWEEMSKAKLITL